ncbi:low molecular weight protein-tyrosine-phosphatase [Nitrogeniibacter aestuarii]|uniref:low molecular weight protein-tyrosine-phosphatase n=1 Tax=Nitrogeniibacter aestuarii TaxID=2815343 RepID=UPI001D12348B|nr:low molecular weight protein-tyrosine-phosphatase [Nitrogeniibacter aestuarii]
MKRRILFVCTGNICRSPTAEAVARHWLRMVGLDGEVQVDSAGIGGYHVGEAPDARSQQFASKRGYDMSKLRARKITADDYAKFDLILAMDQGHYQHMKRKCPDHLSHKLKMFLEYATNVDGREVPDPYYGGLSGFDHVLDLCEAGVHGIIDSLREELV